jgi:hypothetical protein
MALFRLTPLNHTELNPHLPLRTEVSRAGTFFFFDFAFALMVGGAPFEFKGADLELDAGI